MSTPDPRRDDELDYIIRETLRTETEFETPPAYTWNEIQSRLTEESSTARKFRIFWLTPALQAALMLVLIFLQGVTPYSYSYSTQPTPVTSQMETTPLHTEMRTTVPAVTRTDDDLDMRLLKEKTEVATHNAQREFPTNIQPLPTANVFVRKQRLQRNASAHTESPPTPIMLKHNLDLNQ